MTAPVAGTATAARDTVKRMVASLCAGLVFGLGLVVSGMTNPAKVLGFLDVFGAWDPSLAFVMLAAVVVTGVGYRLVWRRRGPVLADSFELPGTSGVDRRLAAGAVLFGIGWGLAGLCPGPAIAALSVGGDRVLVFLLAMAAGMAAFELLDRRQTPAPA